MSRSNRAIDLFDALAHLGIRGSIHRASYELLNRSGARTILEPAGEAAAARALRRERTIEYSRWISERPPFFLRSCADAGRTLQSADDRELLNAAAEAEAGRLKAFGSTAVDYGRPLAWHVDPFTGQEWPRQHWSQCQLRAPGKEIKLIWEPARFGQTFLFMRALAATGDDRWRNAFYTHVRDWIAENPYRVGIHWANGQEIAIRLFAWICGLYAFADSRSDPGIVFVEMQRSIALQCRQVERHVSYAIYSMRNNHVIGEALALFLVGTLFPWLRNAGRWERRGRALLERSTARQFRGSGEYVQNSHTYHRLALSYLSVASLAGDSVGRRLPPSVSESIAHSVELLGKFMNSRDGRLPNWGENDGADLFPITGADYTDFRPALALAQLSIGGGPQHQAGECAEAIGAWVSPAARVERIRAAREIQSLKVMNAGPGNFVALRTPPWRGALGHADLNHADVWLAGVNVACDTGSYMYSVEREIHQWLSSTPAHNTVSIPGASQRRRLRSWNWAGPTAGRSVTTDNEIGAICESYFHHPDGQLSHTRTVSPTDSGFIVVDAASQARGSGPLALQWLLMDAEWQLIVSNDVPHYDLQAASNGRRFRVTIELAGVQAQQVEHSIVRASPDRRRGWQSRYYGKLDPAVSVQLLVHSRSLVARSRFSVEA
ncbi:MAG TPA: heparinase II/III family protein [Gemmatimonadaceae bacterium]|nr:heparinase II/III family protein [Gemmatimonadaceae bacterium]